jgi:hypothetical protein
LTQSAVNQNLTIFQKHRLYSVGYLGMENNQHITVSRHPVRWGVKNITFS